MSYKIGSDIGIGGYVYTIRASVSSVAISVIPVNAMTVLLLDFVLPYREQ
jgi:hypothetical protein